MNVYEYAKRKIIFYYTSREYVMMDIIQEILGKRNKFNIYWIRHGSAQGYGCFINNVVKIKDESFFDEYYYKYQYLYSDITYFIFYKLQYEKIRPSRQISKLKRKKIYERDNYKCILCECDKDYKLTLDHIRPLSVTNDNSYYNLATLCHDCNNYKRDSERLSNLIVNKIVANVKNLKPFG